jgi:hypothetical protein
MSKYKFLSEQALTKLPRGKFIAFRTTHDMNNEKRDAVVWEIYNIYDRSLRLAYFCIHTGEYIGEYLGQNTLINHLTSTHGGT